MQGGRVWRRDWQSKQKKNGDINRIPQNMQESRDEGPASGERGPQREAEYYSRHQKKKQKLRQRTPPT